MKVFLPAAPANEKEPLTASQRVHLFPWGDRLGLTHRPRSLRPLILRSIVNLTELGSERLNENLVPVFGVAFV